MRLLCKQQLPEDYCRLLLIDAFNSSNEDNRTTLMWEVRQECLIGIQFTFNCYRHWATLVIQDEGGGGALPLQ